MRNRTTWTFVLIVALIAALALAGGCKRAAESPDLGLGGAAETSGSPSVSGSASDSANPKAAIEITGDGTGADGSPGAGASTGGSGAGNSGGGSGSGGSGSGGSSAGGSGGTGGGSSAPAATTMVRIKYWNDVTSGKAASPRIVLGGKTFAPAGSAKPIVGSVGPIAFNKTVRLLVYPDGPNGPVLSVPIKVTTDMSPSSDLDAIHVAISNDTVRVLGNPVDNFEHSFERFNN